MTASRWTIKKLFSYLNRNAGALKKNEGDDLIAHLILSHGFMEWQNIIFKQFPILGWRGEAVEVVQRFEFKKHMRFFYDRFFLLIAELPSFAGMSEEAKAKLKEEGWKEYLKD